MKGMRTRRIVLRRLLGEGGFGSVYRATLQDPGGYSRDVAIKVLNDPSPPAAVLQRFRDEARILGLLRDRAIVTAAAPIQIDGRWAVEMELVEGASLAALYAEHGAFPTGAALEIVSEVARALHTAWNTPGPDNKPLHLVHRDLKPGNILLTRAGEVKIIDFGLAKARFEAREVQTEHGLAGTLGYIAPERFETGAENEVTDVYSLGVILEQILLGRRLAPHDPRPSFVPGSLKAGAMVLATQMRSPAPEDRPRARDVERICAQLLRQAGPTESLRDWAERTVPEAGTEDNDAVLAELEDHELLSSAELPKGGGLAMAGMAGTVALLAVTACLGVGIGGLAVSQLAGPREATVATGPRPTPGPDAVVDVDAPDPAGSPEAPRPDGSTGAGSTGAGSTGAGSTGAGSTGPTGVPVVGVPVPTGAAGTPGGGPSGSSDASGSSGADPSGATGTSGAVGPTGTSGAVGPTGAVGATDPSGAVGSTGTSRATDPSGANGTSGAVGASDPSGANGTSGAAGAGTSGAAGAPDPSGAVGATGPSGANGTEGTTAQPAAVGPVPTPPEPAPTAPSLRAPEGAWSGTLKDRPLSVQLRAAGPGRVTGSMAFALGPMEVAEGLAGTVTRSGEAWRLDVQSDSGTYRLVGDLGETSGQGDVEVNGKRRATWTLRRDR
ncbi:MAG: serine/threonine protein kinase [Alphaproteobacteria bacterium]|nr:serine/threonine protein kinase [Alphaproteobacteria bacterium]